MNTKSSARSALARLVDATTARWSRRRFLPHATALGGVVCLGAPALPSGRNLNSKLNIAMIGLGGKSGDNLKGIASENVVALCEVDGASLDRIGAKYPTARRHRDLRKTWNGSMRAKAGRRRCPTSITPGR